VTVRGTVRQGSRTSKVTLFRGTRVVRNQGTKTARLQLRATAVGRRQLRRLQASGVKGVRVTQTTTFAPLLGDSRRVATRLTVRP